LIGGVVPQDVFLLIVCQCDVGSFSELTQACKYFNNVCNKIPVDLLLNITFSDLGHYRNQQLIGRFIEQGTIWMLDETNKEKRIPVDFFSVNEKEQSKDDQVQLECVKIPFGRQMHPLMDGHATYCISQNSVPCCYVWVMKGSNLKGGGFDENFFGFNIINPLTQASQAQISKFIQDCLKQDGLDTTGFNLLSPENSENKIGFARYFFSMVNDFGDNPVFNSSCNWLSTGLCINSFNDTLLKSCFMMIFVVAVWKHDIGLIQLLLDEKMISYLPEGSRNFFDSLRPNDSILNTIKTAIDCTLQ
jgi:hypothetical protein